MPIKTMPEGCHALTPLLAIRGAVRAMQFYKDVFGATEVMRLVGADGRVAHAEMKIGDSLIMLADESPGYNHTPQEFGGTTVILSLYVEDVDATMSRALAAGAKLVIPVEDQFYGDRSGRIEDPFGHVWILATHKEDVSPEEMQRRFQSFISGKTS